MSMSNKTLRADLLAILQLLLKGDLHAGCVSLLEKLGYASLKTVEFPAKPEEFARELQALVGGDKKLHAEHAALADWQSAHFLFQLTNDELPALAAGQLSLLQGAGGVQAHQMESFVFLAIDLQAGVWSRTRLAAITRELNRLFPMPAVLLFRHPREDGAPLLSIAVIHRRANKRDSQKDVIEGKVSIIKDIDLAAPHAAHLRILESMALGQVDAKFVPTSFDALYKAWLDVLSVKELNERFYKELAHWYYWAIRKETGVVFPLGQKPEPPDDPFTNDRPTVAIIRLLTRLIFVWFLKEKRLVPAELFDEKSLASLLHKPPHQHDTAGNYYKAILQNLFFATLNTEMADVDEDGNKQRIWREASGPKRLQKYLIHTAYRYKAEFKDADAALKLFRQVPFLNGGLFECLDKLILPEDLERDPSLAQRVVSEGKQTVLRVDGFSEREENPIHIPNALFFGDGSEVVDLNAVFGTTNRKYKPRGIINIFESYKFTIEENTPVEEEVALDPELLGKVFENLLASYNPDTKTTARKKSGSFYTPREVVDYMVDESLVCYLERPLAGIKNAQSATHLGANGLLDLDAGPGDLALSPTALHDQPVRSEPVEAASGNPLPSRLRHLLSYHQSSHDFNSEEAHGLIAAIERLRVLDPACGSGAFPMGMLQKLVHVLRKLDPDNVLWRAQNRAPLEEQLASAKKLKDPNLREEQIGSSQAALEKFDADFADPEYADYARKLYLIEKCLYGVDIQPIAVQIAKLRFFISLVVEQKLGTDHQRLTPLPNLETKIVAANTLLPIPRSGVQQDLLANPAVAEKEAELREANASHFAAKRFADKRKRKERILRLRDELSQLLKEELTLQPSDAQAMTAWDPFDQNKHAEFFDPEWMFGWREGFDILIGNPPYVRHEEIKELTPILKNVYQYECASSRADLYVFFYERSVKLLKPDGVLSFITSNKWYRAKYGAGLRQFMATHTRLRIIIDFGDEAVFTALAYPTIVIASRREKPIYPAPASELIRTLNWEQSHTVETFPTVFAEESFAVPQSDLKKEGWQLASQMKRQLLARIRAAGKPLGAHDNGRMYSGIKTGLNEAFVINAATRARLIEEDANSTDLIKPYLRGRDVKRWRVEWSGLYLITFPYGFHEKLESYSAILRHLSQFEEALRMRGQCTSSRGGKQEGQHHWLELDNNPKESYLAKFEQPKIVVPDIASSPQFCWSDEGSVVDMTAFIIATEEKWWLAVLNSSTWFWCFSQLSSQIQNGYFRFKAQYCEQVPIPAASKQQKDICTALVNYAAIVDDSRFERLINGLVYELFFPEDLHAKNIRLFAACEQAGISAGMDAQAIAAAIFHPSHPIYGMLFELQTVEVVRLIEADS